MQSLYNWAVGRGTKTDDAPDPAAELQDKLVSDASAAPSATVAVVEAAPAAAAEAKPAAKTKVKGGGRFRKKASVGKQGLQAKAKRVQSDFDPDAELAKVKAREAKLAGGGEDEDGGDKDDLDTRDGGFGKPPMNAYPPQAPKVEFPAIGSRVVLQGLKAKPELNGATGAVSQHIAEKGRCGVKLDAGHVLSLKPANLRAETAADVEAATKEAEAAKPPPAAAAKAAATAKTAAASAEPVAVGVGEAPPPPVEIKVSKNTLSSITLEWIPNEAAKGATLYVVEMTQHSDEDDTEGEWIKVYQSNICKCEVKKGRSDFFPDPLKRVSARVSAISLKRARSESVKTTFYAVQPCIKEGVKGFGPKKSYWWTQDVEEMEITVPITDVTNSEVAKGGIAKQYNCEIHRSTILLEKRGVSPPIFKGNLNEDVEVDDCCWELHKGNEGEHPYIVVTLYKKAPSWAMLGLTAPSQFWPYVVDNHPHIDAEHLKANVPEEVKAGEGKKAMRQKNPYGREAERAGHARYGLDVNASPSQPYDGFQGTPGIR